MPNCHRTESRVRGATKMTNEASRHALGYTHDVAVDYDAGQTFDLSKWA